MVLISSLRQRVRIALQDNKVSRMKYLLFGGIAAALALAPGLALADTVTPGDGATGNGPWTLTSVGFSDSYVDVSLSTPIAFDTLATLSATFTDTVGGVAGGSPRFGVYASNGDFFLAYLGAPPSFVEGDPATFTAAYSGTELNNGTNNSAYENSGSYVTLASLEATYGSDLITDIAFIVDGGWATAGNTQSLALNSIDINGQDYSSSASATPLPATLPLFAGGLGFVGYLTRRKKRHAQAFAS
jgi:hypothetical protein